MASKSVARFRKAVETAGLADTIVRLDDSARTAEEAAAALGCETGQIVKSLVFADTQRQPLLVLAAGDRRVDEQRIAALHGAAVELGDAALVRATAGYAIGGVPPFGHAQALPTLMDRSLERWHQVWAAAGTPHTVFSIRVADLEQATGARVVEVGA